MSEAPATGRRPGRDYLSADSWHESHRLAARFFSGRERRSLDPIWATLVRNPRDAGESALSKQTILSLYLPSVMMSLGEGIAAPVLPQLAKSFDVSLTTALLIVIVHQWGSVVSTFPTGYLVDRFGRRPVML